MKNHEAAALLTIAAAFDNRKPDAEKAKAWAVILGDLRFEDCQAAILAHYDRSTEFLMPAMVKAGVRRIREDRLRRAGYITPTEELEAITDPEEFERKHKAWYREAVGRIANGEPPEVVIPPRAITGASAETIARAISASKGGTRTGTTTPTRDEENA